MRAPAPGAPKKKDALPMASKSDAISLKSASSPAHRKMSCPLCAGPFEPDTGASTNRPPFSVTCLERRIMSSGARVAQSTILLVSLTPARIPSAASYTAFAASGVESITYTSVHDLTTAAAASQHVIVPSGKPAANAVHLSAERFHTARVWPALIRFFAMPSPMIPSPINPICDMFLRVSSVVCRLSVSVEQFWLRWEYCSVGWSKRARARGCRAHAATAARGRGDGRSNLAAAGRSST
eukprot:201624-Pleurochrysis_carterae.AAC.3